METDGFLCVRVRARRERQFELSQTFLPSPRLSPAALARTILPPQRTKPSPRQATAISTNSYVKSTMQEVRHPFDTNTSSCDMADVALVYLTPPADHRESQALPFQNTFAPIVPRLLDKATLLTAAPRQHNDSTGANGPRIKAEIEIPSTPLPSLLQYVDHILMRDKGRHDRPPHAAQKCISCNVRWDKARVPSTFLPLSPCNHWTHYRCLIELAIRAGLHKGRCYACNTPLYEWDGINTLTLARRTNLPMNDDQATMTKPSTHSLAISDCKDYEQECEFIDNTIERRFFKQLAKRSGFSDNSPDLVQCFNDALNDLRLMGRPTSKWLTWTTTIGSLLFGMLVAIKMQRFMTECHGRIKHTEAWVAWEEGCRALQARMLEEVHRQ